MTFEGIKTDRDFLRYVAERLTWRNAPRWIGYNLLLYTLRRLEGFSVEEIKDAVRLVMLRHNPTETQRGFREALLSH